MALAVAEGAASVPGVEAQLLLTDSVRAEDLLAAHAIVVGSPVYNAAVAPQVQAFINRWPFEGSPLRDKIGAAFATGGGISAGEELVQTSLLHSMLIFGMIVIGGPSWEQAFGASAITHEAPFGAETGLAEMFRKKGFRLGERVGMLAVRMGR